MTSARLVGLSLLGSLAFSCVLPSFDKVGASPDASAGSGGVGGAAGSAGMGGTAGIDGGAGMSGSAGSGGMAGSDGGPSACPGNLVTDVPASCASGPQTACGFDKTDDCCTTTCVPGGSFSRSYSPASMKGFTDPQYTATLSPVFIDRYEVTVRRFREFLDKGTAYAANPPTPGAGAHGSFPGWDATWPLPQSRMAWDNQLSGSVYCTSHQGWNGNLDLPMNCVSWYQALAFCIWDGGRLPSEAEWNFTAAGGAEQRSFPWGDSPPPNGAEYVLLCNEFMASGDCLVPFAFRQPGGFDVGALGRWGHADLAASLVEYTLDSASFVDTGGIGGNIDLTSYDKPCNDCVHWNPTDNGRVERGDGAVGTASTLEVSFRFAIYPNADTSTGSGFRCARPARTK